MGDEVVVAEHVSKRFAGHTAVHDLSLAVPRGGIFGLLGPNGAGKTTTLRMIMNIIAPDEGRVVLLGGAGTGRELSGRIGYLPEERGLYPKMRVLDHLAFLGEAKGLTRPEARRRARRWLERVGLGDWALKKVADLSKGMQQKVQFAGALQHEPDLLILDEPFSGLDPVNSKVMRDVVVEIARSGRTVLFSTHIMEHAEQMCDRITIIARGEKLVDGPLGQVKRDFGESHIALTFTRHAGLAQRILADRSLVAHCDDSGATAEVRLAGGVEPDRLLRVLVEADVGLSRFELVEPSLQSIFLAKVGPEAGYPAARAEVA